MAKSNYNHGAWLAQVIRKIPKPAAGVLMSIIQHELMISEQMKEAGDILSIDV